MSADGPPVILAADLREIIDRLDAKVLGIAEDIQARRTWVEAALASAGEDLVLRRQAICQYVMAVVECAGEAAMMTRMREGIETLRVDLGKSTQFSTKGFDA